MPNIDYQNPIIQEMKKMYRDSREKHELAYATRTSVEGDKITDRVRISFQDARTELVSAESGIQKLIDQVGMTEALSTDDKGLYVTFMQSHLLNIKRWSEDCKRILESE